MRHGIDTDFLLAVEIREHPFHEPAHALFEKLLSAGDSLALAPQVLAEFAHVATDQRRFPKPLSMPRALERAKWWWEASEVEQVFPGANSVALALEWMEEHSLGRKRILDTHLAAMLRMNEVSSLVTNNQSDFRVFECFELLDFRSEENTTFK